MIHALGSISVSLDRVYSGRSEVNQSGVSRSRSRASIIYGVKIFRESLESIAISESSRNRERFRYLIEQNDLSETPRRINLTA